MGSRGPQPKLDLYTIFNYILKLLYLGCQWQELPIEKDKDGRTAIHYTSIYRAFRRFENQGCDGIFEYSVLKLHQTGLLDVRVIHGDGTTTAANKGGDHLGCSGHKHLKGDIVAWCERNCNVIAPRESLDRSGQPRLSPGGVSPRLASHVNWGICRCHE